MYTNIASLIPVLQFRYKQKQTEQCRVLSTKFSSQSKCSPGFGSTVLAQPKCHLLIFALEIMESMKKTKEIQKMGLKNKTLHQINNVSDLRVH